MTSGSAGDGAGVGVGVGRDGDIDGNLAVYLVPIQISPLVYHLVKEVDELGRVQIVDREAPFVIPEDRVDYCLLRSGLRSHP